MGTSPYRKKNGEGGAAVEYGPVTTVHALSERIGLMDVVNRAAPKVSENIPSRAGRRQSLDGPGELPPLLPAGVEMLREGLDHIHLEQELL